MLWSKCGGADGALPAWEVNRQEVEVPQDGVHRYIVALYSFDGHLLSCSAAEDMGAADALPTSASASAFESASASASVVISDKDKEVTQKRKLSKAAAGKSDSSDSSDSDKDSDEDKEVTQKRKLSNAEEPAPKKSKCGNEGHMSRECLEPRKGGGGGGGGACYNCGEEGHMSYDCPQPVSAPCPFDYWCVMLC